MRLVFAFAALGLASCATPGSVTTAQTAGPGDCVTLARAGGDVIACPVRTPVATFKPAGSAGACHVSLTVRPEGNVAHVRKIGGGFNTEQYCRNSAFRWRFSLRDADGNPVSENVKGLEAVMVVERAASGTGSDAGFDYRINISFDPKEFDALKGEFDALKG